jgi:two-component system LytT family response regulator
MKIKACIIEDTPSERIHLANTIAACKLDVEIVGAVATLEEGIELIYQRKPDVVFLDVVLAGNRSGFELFEKIPNPNFEVIFVTGYDKYALKAIQVACLDYLTKPVTTKGVSGALERLKKRREPAILPERLALLLSNSGNNPEKVTKMALPCNSGFILQKLSTITHFIADTNHAYMHTLEEDNPKLISYSFTKLKEILPPTFHLIHRSILVNLNLVKEIDRAKYRVILENGEALEISHRNVPKLLRRVLRIQEGKE